MENLSIEQLSDQLFWSIVRFFCTLFILIVVNIILINVNPYIVLLIDLIIVCLFDSLDSIPLRMKYGSDWGDHMTYQVYDKICDMLLYLMVIILHLMRVRHIGGFEMIFIGLYLFRLIGVVLAIVNKNNVYIILFPNFFMDSVILYLLMKYVFHWSNGVILTVILLSIPLKYAYEYLHHAVWNKLD